MAFAIYNHHNHNNLVDSNIILQKTYVIAQELKQSSNDLTRFCRTYVKTVDSSRKNKYWELSDIRNGSKIRFTIPLSD